MESSSPPLILVQSWYRPQLFLALLFCIVWDGFLVGWYARALHQPANLFGLIFPLAHVGIGLCLTYATLAGFVNRTTFGVGDGELVIRHGPLPWPGNRRLPAAALRQILDEGMASIKRRPR